MLSPNDALARLKEGNLRFIDKIEDNDFTLDKLRDFTLTTEHHPVAIILGCADARVPADIIFDQGPGDLFVVRVAGNIAAESQIGSIEYAAKHLGTQLVVVLGHSNCGAVQATLNELIQPSNSLSNNLCSIVNRIKPALEGTVDSSSEIDAELMQNSVRANVRQSVENLKQSSDIVAELLSEGKLKIVGAEYSLATGKVEFLD